MITFPAGGESAFSAARYGLRHWTSGADRVVPEMLSGTNIITQKRIHRL
jgi:hypothetical protein